MERSLINEETKKCRVLVYGTLRKGWGLNRAYLSGEGSRYLGTIWVKDYIMLDHIGYPAAVHHPDTLHAGVVPRIWCECYEIDEDVLGMLDMAEGVHSGLYDRVIVDTATYGKCYMYCQEWKTMIGKRWIPDGVWDIETRRKSAKFPEGANLVYNSTLIPQNLMLPAKVDDVKATKEEGSSKKAEMSLHEYMKWHTQAAEAPVREAE